MINPAALPALLDGANAPHFKAAGEGRLLIQHCKACDRRWFPAAHLCPRCLTPTPEWAQATGKATLWSWCEFHRPYFKALADKVPYVVVAVQLEEGTMLYGNLVDATVAELKIGMHMQAVFVPAEGGGTVNFKPAGN